MSPAFALALAPTGDGGLGRLHGFLFRGCVQLGLQLPNLVTDAVCRQSGKALKLGAILGEVVSEFSL